MIKRYEKIITIVGLVGGIGLSSGVYADANDHAVVRDAENQVVHSSNGNCVRTKWTDDSDECARQIRTTQTVIKTIAPQKASTLTKEQRTVYFEFNHADLSYVSLAGLDTLSQALKYDESVKQARVIGYADRIGSFSYNKKLSKQRAETVLNYLVLHGYTNAHVTETRWVGKSEPSAHCPAKDTRHQLITCLQPDRRVEVEIDLLPDLPLTKSMPSKH